MTFAHLRVIFWTLGCLLLAEVGLEYRAVQRGWAGAPLWDAVRTPSSATRPSPLTVDARIDAPNPIRDPRASLRIWVASASHADPAQLESGRTFPVVLAERLRGLGYPADVFNASRPGKHIRDNIADLRAMGPPWQPQLAVLYQMSLEINELSEEFLAPPVRAAAKAGADGDRAVAAPTPGWTVRFVEDTAAYRLLKGRITPHLAAARVLANHLGSDAEREFEARVRHFVQESADLGARPVLCTFATSHGPSDGPVPQDVRHFMLRYNPYLSAEGWFESVARLNGAVRRVAQTPGVALVDLDAALSRRPEYFRDYVHFNAEGHRVAGEALAATLAASGSLSTTPMDALAR